MIDMRQVGHRVDIIANLHAGILASFLKLQKFECTPNAPAQGQGPKTQLYMFSLNRHRGRVPWSSSLGRMALNGGQPFAVAYPALLTPDTQKGKKAVSSDLF
jgi:hypothetical protein